MMMMMLRLLLQDEVEGKRVRDRPAGTEYEVIIYAMMREERKVMAVAV